MEKCVAICNRTVGAIFFFLVQAIVKRNPTKQTIRSGDFWIVLFVYARVNEGSHYGVTGFLSSKGKEQSYLHTSTTSVDRFRTSVHHFLPDYSTWDVLNARKTSVGWRALLTATSR
ncbi:hypothetical protein PUN28_011976 [Cardiocondyla obscurior]|uniref:Uncharacterized protein n=1 Tax=Cardiocondyla obscurior TaxID=286306 RepID=A0AAW2FAR3_9HYME